MPLLLVDLDNTLIDRAGAFERWKREYATRLSHWSVPYPDIST